MEGGLLLNGVVRESMAVFQLFSNGDEVLLVGWDPFVVLYLGLQLLDGVWWLEVTCDGLASEDLDKDLFSTKQSEEYVDGGFLMDVVIREDFAVYELLSTEHQSLLIGWDAFSLMDLCP